MKTTIKNATIAGLILAAVLHIGAWCIGKSCTVEVISAQCHWKDAETLQFTGDFKRLKGHALTIPLIYGTLGHGDELVIYQELNGWGKMNEEDWQEREYVER